MSQNQTINGVSRELLEKLWRSANGMRWTGVSDELRALLDAPVIDVRNKCGVQMVDCPECTHQWDHFFDCGNKPAAQSQGDPVVVVPELTSELRWILGQMCFQHIHTAQALRLMGHEIARKAEDEQAVTIYWMLSHYLKDPAN